MTRRRKLSPEERELWARVASSTRAIRSEKPVCAETEPVLKPGPKVHHPRSAAELREFRIGQQVQSAHRGHDLSPSIGEHLARQPVVMDRKAHRKMTSGKLEPEAKIDLHGMTVAQAHPELIRFILNSQDRGRRLVLVITGKGKMSHDDGPIPQRQGVLRHQVPQWLRMPPLGPAVMQVSQAHLKHGGAGAYYGYLRRTR